MGSLFQDYQRKRNAERVDESLLIETFGPSKNKFLLQSSLMTAADLGAVTKPWLVHRHVSQLIAEEFWSQGDRERNELHLDPPPMLDRRASLSAVQIGFIDNICSGLYHDMVALEDSFLPMLEGCFANRQKWVSIEEKKEDQTEQ